MSLISALNAGKSAMAVQQAAIQVTGNNIANAGSATYTRQVARTSPNPDQEVRPGLFVGTGVNLTSIQRQIDEALEGRIRGSISDSEGAAATQQWLGRVEALFNELSDEDLSSQLSTFFNSWSNLANKPQDVGLRQIVVQNGTAVADTLQSLRGGLENLQKDVDDRLTAMASNADALAQQIADLNGQIVIAEGGSGGQANGLRDQRDAALRQLAEIVDIKVIDQGNGMVNVTVGSEPLVVGTTNRGVTTKTTIENGNLITTAAFKADNGNLQLGGGQLGALSAMSEKIASVIDDTDLLASSLIFELNKLHASGQGLEGFSTVTGSNAVDDATAVLNNDDAGLDFVPVNGSFVVHLKQTSSGLVTSTLVKVDLDGLNGDDTTLTSLAADIDAIAGLSATVTAGKLRISVDSPDAEVSFSQDSSGALAALGINNFFSGTDARDIAVSASIKDNPMLLAAAKNGQSGDNQTARAIAALESAALTSLRGASLKDKYQRMINGIAVDAQAAKTNADAARTVQETLLAQRESLSGVSLDEEAINLVRQQRAFQGAARLIQAIDEMMQTVLQLV